MYCLLPACRYDSAWWAWAHFKGVEDPDEAAMRVSGRTAYSGAVRMVRLDCLPAWFASG